MKRNRLLMVLGRGFSLPYSLDFSTLPDGPLPGRLVGSTWAIAGGKAVNTPTLGDELITNGNFAAWTGDNPDGWNIYNAPELAGDYVTEVAGAVRIVRTTKAIGIYKTIGVDADVFRISRNVTNFVSGDLRIYGNGSFLGGKTGPINGAEDVGVITQDVLFGTTLNEFRVFANANSTDVTIDDVSMKAVSGLFALLPATRANINVKCTPTVIDYSAAGVIARADSRISPLNYLLGVYDKGRGSVLLIKSTNGAFTEVAAAAVSYAAGGLLELRCNGTTIEVWYYNVKKITQTVDVATINNNTIHGMVSFNGGNSLDSFFCTAL